MIIGHQILAWRRYRKMTQQALSRQAGLTRPYVSRLEGGHIDPALSCLRRLAAALGIGPGDLIEGLPQPRRLSRNEMDQWARAALQPTTQESRRIPEARSLAQLFRERRKAM